MTDLSNPLAAKKQSYGTVALRWLLYLFWVSSSFII